MNTYTLGLPKDGPSIAQIIKSLPIAYRWFLSGTLVSTRSVGQKSLIACETSLNFTGNERANYVSQYKGGDDDEAIQNLVAVHSHTKMPEKVVFKGVGLGFALGTPTITIAIGIASEYVRHGYVGFLKLYNSEELRDSPLFNIRIPEGSEKPTLVVQKAATAPEVIEALTNRFGLKELETTTT